MPNKEDVETAVKLLEQELKEEIEREEAKRN